jgi:hypothetical protein
MRRRGGRQTVSRSAVSSAVHLQDFLDTEQQIPMADYNKYDPRVDSLVMETRTNWDPAVGKLSDEDKALLARTVHQSPEKAAKCVYYRSHTGFTREITVTVEDIARIYDEQTSRA